MLYFYSLPFSIYLYQENCFTKCDTCTMVKNEVHNTGDPERRKHFREILDKHNHKAADVNEIQVHTGVTSEASA